MRCIKAILLNLLENTKGQIVILFALMTPIIIGFVGISIDTGWIVLNKAKIQNAADFSALSAAYYLPATTTLEKKTASSVALSTFNKNYSNDSNTPVSIVSNINLFGQNSEGVKVHYERKLPLFFMSVFGINEINIVGKAEAMVLPLSKPDMNMIPVAFEITKLPNPMVYGTTLELWGTDVTNSQVGNFGLIDPSNGQIPFSGTLLQDWICYGYPYKSNGTKYINDTPPAVGTIVDTKPGQNAGPVAKAFEIRIAEGRNIVYCPVVDFNVAKGGATKVKILGYIRLESLGVTTLTDKGNTYVKITGKFTKFTTDLDSDSSAEYYGVGSIRLIK